MITYYCPACWEENRTGAEVCPACGFHLAEYDALEFEQKLLRAARHPVASYRCLAVEILGKLGASSAVPLLAEILHGPETDPYLLRAALEAAARIPGAAGRKLVEDAGGHPSRLVRDRARELLQRAGDP